jgi:hypothetical protein
MARFDGSKVTPRANHTHQADSGHDGVGGAAMAPPRLEPPAPNKTPNAETAQDLCTKARSGCPSRSRGRVIPGEYREAVAALGLVAKVPVAPVDASFFWRKRSCCPTAIALAIAICLSAQSYGQDLGVEIADPANRAVADLKTTLSENRSVIKAFNDQASVRRDALQRMARRLGIPTTAPCAEQEKSTTERVTVAIVNFNSLKSRVDTALTTETEQFQRLQRDYNFAKSSDAQYLTQITLYDKLVWSRARSEMISTIRSVLMDDFLASQLQIENICLGRKILDSNGIPYEADKIIREATVRSESEEAERVTSRREFYTQILNLVMGYGR